MKAIVVDDSLAARFMISKIVKKVGFDVVEAANGKDALVKLEANQDVSVLFVDWNMPVMNGLELVKEIRQHPEQSEIKIVMVTTETEMSQVMRALEAGADDYVMKPFTEDVILDKMKILGIAE
jgi:two-component system, chemotaxis family, chemotaxis protein CheY